MNRVIVGELSIFTIVIMIFILFVLFLTRSNHSCADDYTRLDTSKCGNVYCVKIENSTVLHYDASTYFDTEKAFYAVAIPEMILFGVFCILCLFYHYYPWQVVVTRNNSSNEIEEYLVDEEERVL